MIYYWRNQVGEIWLLTIYAKSEAADIPLAVLKALRKEVEKTLSIAMNILSTGR